MLSFRHHPTSNTTSNDQVPLFVEGLFAGYGGHRQGFMVQVGQGGHKLHHLSLSKLAAYLAIPIF